MFWAAINAGDRVDSALKDMAVVMKQLDRSDEAIEAIKSFRYLCPNDSQESLDNILIELYKVKHHSLLESFAYEGYHNAHCFLLFYIYLFISLLFGDIGMKSALCIFLLWSWF